MACVATIAAVPIAVRIPSVISGAGLSSRTFWWRRCNEQSPLEQVHRVAVCVGEYLHLDMARSLDATLYEHPVVPEAGTGLAPRACERILEPGLGVGASHSLAAAARDRLHQHRKADPAGMRKQGRVVLLVAVVAGDNGHAGTFHYVLGGILQAHRADRFHRRADEDDAGGGACLDEHGILRQESVSRMHRVRARCGCRRDHPLDVQVALRRGCGAEPPCLAGRGHVQRVPVRVGVDRDGADAEPVRGAHHPAGDLAAVGDEELAEHQRCFPHSMWRFPGISRGFRTSIRGFRT